MSAHKQGRNQEPIFANSSFKIYTVLIKKKTPPSFINRANKLEWYDFILDEKENYRFRV